MPSRSHVEYSLKAAKLPRRVQSKGLQATLRVEFIRCTTNTMQRPCLLSPIRFHYSFALLTRSRQLIGSKVADAFFYEGCTTIDQTKTLVCNRRQISPVQRAKSRSRSRLVTCHCSFCSKMSPSRPICSIFRGTEDHKTDENGFSTSQLPLYEL